MGFVIFFVCVKANLFRIFSRKTLSFRKSASIVYLKMLTLCSYLIFVFLYWIVSRSTDRYCLRFSRLQLRSAFPQSTEYSNVGKFGLNWTIRRCSTKQLQAEIGRAENFNTKYNKVKISQSGRDYDTLMHNLHKFYSVRHARMTSRMFKAFQTRRLKPKEIFTNVIYYAFFSSERIHQMWTRSNRAINGYNQTSICTQIQTTIFFLKPRLF